MILIHFVGGATFVVLPAFSKLHGGPELDGLLLMAQAMGCMFGTLIAPFSKLERMGMGLIYAVSFSVSGMLWTLCVLSPNIWMMMVIYGLSWVPGGVTHILINSYIQKGIPQLLSRRVFSASYSLSGIAAPIGSLCGGILGEVFGSEVIIGLSGVVCVIDWSVLVCLIRRPGSSQALIMLRIKYFRHKKISIASHKKTP